MRKTFLKQQAVNKIVGRNIRNKRRALRIDSSALGEHINVSRQSIFNYERGKVTVSTDKLHAIAGYFQISINELFKGVKGLDLPDTKGKK